MLGKLTADRRLAHFLLDISSRLKDHGLSESKFNLMMTRNDIANYLGLAIETVSRVLTRFQKQGIIEVDRRSVHIHDFPRLRDIIITAAADDTTASAPARQLPSPRTRADTTQRSLQHADAADAASRSPRHRLISPGASPTSSQHELFLSPSGSMSGSTESNQSSQIIELPPLGADPETVSHSSRNRESFTPRPRVAQPETVTLRPRDCQSLTPRP